MRHFHRRVSSALAVFAVVAVASTSACGGSPAPAERTAQAAPSAPPPSKVLGPPSAGTFAAAATCTPLKGHDAFGTQSCESCHPCGAKATSGHQTGWLDTTSTSFHAYQANANLASCQGCHGPALDGVGGSATTSCARCHDANLPAGVASWKNNCVMCHGGTNDASGAPPKTTWGNAADAVRVGAHAAHTGGTRGLAAPLTCAACHPVPVDALSVGHANGPTADVAFTGLGAQGATATWSRATATCATYCHGTTLAGGTASTPVWTLTDGSQVACGACHGAPPPAPHPTSTACGACHAGYTTTTVARATHLDGAVQYALGPASCGLCHGAPPATPSHRTAAGLTTCVTCHDRTVDATGALLVSGLHRNGAVDLSATMTCAKCHGTAGRVPNPTSMSDEVAGAPPRDLSGNTVATAPGVGAHLVHVNGTRSKNLLCSDCHDVSSILTGLWSHANGRVEMAFSPLASAGGVPTYALGSGGSCGATYCHGNFAGGAGAVASPAWTAAGTLGCGSCHGNPPPLATTRHPANPACATCHGAGYSSSSVVQATHVNGTVEKPQNGCTACHGVLAGLAGAAVASTSPASAPGYTAAAVDTTGVSAATAATVGAHAAHLSGTRWRATPVACVECHVVPAAGDTAHATGTGSGGARATVTFGPLARTGNVTTAAYAGSNTATGGNTAGSCSNTYCHGNFKNGATTAVVSWLGGAAAAACGSCHGLPPGGNHPANSTCVNCHAGYTATTVNAATHLNGTVDVANMTCTSCHGTAGRASVAGADVNQASAPPTDSRGAATGVLVGTHVAHVNPAAAGQVYRAVACVECHPDNTGNISHSNNAVNVTFATATAANLGGFTAAYVQGNGTTTQTTCTTYCHGSSLNATTTRGSVASWSWNGAAADCGSCHKSPPTTANHHNAAALTTCVTCHAGTVNASGAVLVAGGLHVNGAVDTSTLTCTTCHGGSANAATGGRDANVAAAPTGTGAPDTYGNTAVATANGVGVHAAHVLGNRSKPVLCNACHTVPATQIHKTGAATAGTVVLANLATTGSIATATYAGSGGTCSNTYCHGNLGGGVGATNVTPTWKTAGTLVCNACHGMPPAATSTGRVHPNRTDCGTCHTGYTSTTVSAATHVDGIVQYTTQTCTSCHGDPARTGTDAAGIAFSSAPPVDSSNASTGSKVGAHAKHLLTNAAGGPAFSRQVACSECHAAAIPVNPLHANGQPNVAFGTLATQGTGGATGRTAPSYTAGTVTCANTYCHGNFKNGAAAAVAWTGTVGCTSCHGMPPSGTHPTGANVTATTCGNCHGNYDNGLAATNPAAAILNPALHVDGSVDLSKMACTSCHGTPGRASVATADANQAAAPPAVASATGVAGVHLAHVNQGATGAPLSLPILCATCHVVPVSNTHGDGVIGVSWSGLAVAGGVSPPAYATAAHTCSNTYCHGNFPGGNQSGAALSWSTSGKLSCTACHGNPPATATTHHPANAACASCHGAGYSSTTVVATSHVDGTVQKPVNGCTACHGQLSGLAGAAAVNSNPAAAPGFGGTGVDASGSALATSRGVGAHAKHLTPTLRSAGYACTECHGVLPAAGDTTHANGTVALAAGAITATRGSTLTTSVAGSTLSCSATWCHGGNAALSGATASTIAWNAGATVTCTSCHGNPPTGNGHPNNTACATCHGAGYAYLTATTGSISGAALNTHVDGTVNLVTAESCASCHGAAGRATGGIAGVTYDVNQAAAPPVDSAGASTGVVVGAHLAHVNPAPSVAGATQPSGGVFRPIACVECHPNQTSFTHANGAIDVTFGGGTTASLNGYVPPAPTLRNGTTVVATTCSTYCHGAKLPKATSVTTNNAWNGPAATCSTCHGFPPATLHAGVAANATACATCHPDTVTASGTINIAGGKHMNGIVDGGGEPANGGSSCGGCHATFFNQMTAVTAPRSRHPIGSDVPTDNGSTWSTTGANLSASVTVANRSCVNTCHGDHPHDLTSPVTATHENNVYVNATTSATRASGSATRTTSNRARTDFDPATNAGLCTSCHQNAIAANRLAVAPATFGASAHDYTSNTVGTTTWTWTSPIHDGSTFARNCTKCHASRVEGTTPTAATTQTVHFSADDVHLLAGTTNPAGTAANFACYNCHGSTATPAAGAQGNRSGKDIQTQVAHATTAGQSGHPSNSDAVHDTGVEFANAAFGNALGVAAGPGQRHASCMDCHDPHGAKATTDAAAYTTGTVSIPTTTATCPTTMGGGSNCRTATGSGTTWTSAMVGWKLWVGTAWFTVVQYNSATSLVVYAGASTATAVAAGSAYTLKPYYRATNVAGAPVHNAWGAQLTTNPAFWTAPTSTSFTKKTLASGTDLEATLCFKCHSGYYWGTGATPGSPSGTTVAGTSATAAAGATSVSGSGWTASAYVGYAVKNNALGVWHRITANTTTTLTITPATTAAWSGAYTIQMPQTDTAREFNPGNVGNYATTGTTSWASGETAGGFHPILATASGNLGATGNILPPFSRTSLMQCTDCHDSDAVTDPNGPHGSASKFILKGPNTNWSSSVVMGSAGMPDGTFCANCHRRDFTGSRFTQHFSRSDHRIACFSCHAAIPHGGPRPGILAAGAGGATGVGGTIAGWDTTYPYWQGATTNKLYIASYPTSNTASWAQSNCGCNGTNH